MDTTDFTLEQVTFQQKPRTTQTGQTPRWGENLHNHVNKKNNRERLNRKDRDLTNDTAL